MTSPQQPFLRVWTSAGDGATTLTVLTHHALYMADVPDDRVAAVQRELATGVEPREVLGPDSVVASPLAQLLQAKCVLGEPGLLVDDRIVLFPEQAEAEEALGILRERLQRSHQVETYHQTWPGAIAKTSPLVVLPVLLTVILHGFAEISEKGGYVVVASTNVWRTIFYNVPQALAAALGTRGVLICGGILIALAVGLCVWLLSHFRPSTTHVLTRKGYYSPEAIEASKGFDRFTG